MKIAIDPGHNCPPDTGANGIEQEDILTLDVATRVIQKLTDAEHEVINVLPDTCNSVRQSLRKRVNKANQQEADIYVSIHFNAFNGKAYGTEVFFGSPNGRAIAKSIVSEIAGLGFNDRGVKKGLHLYVIRETIMPAVLVECCFCDSANDMNLYNPEMIAEAITAGLIGRQAADNRPMPQGILVVNKDTTLKQFTFDDNDELDKGEARLQRKMDREISLPAGEYPFNNLHQEEGHYCVNFRERIKGNIDFGCIIATDAIIKN